MNINLEIDRLVERFCTRLGRYGIWSKLFDGIARAVFPCFVSPLRLPGVVGTLSPLSPGWFMSGVDSSLREWGGTFDASRGGAPALIPHPPGVRDRPHDSAKCAPDIFRGMHGNPCKYHGGDATNKFCPAGTTPGLWWRYYVPSLHRNVYYVDCCGLIPAGGPWCNWAKERNWCAGAGGDIYTCTITLFADELKLSSIIPPGYASNIRYASHSRHVLPSP